MSGSCKHQKRCGLLLLRLLYIFLNKIYKKKKIKKKSIVIFPSIINLFCEHNLVFTSILPRQLKLSRVKSIYKCGEQTSSSKPIDLLSIINEIVYLCGAIG